MRAQNTHTNPLKVAWIKANYRSAAKRYAQHSRLQREAAETLLERLDCIPIAPKRILDLGSGTGHAARLLSQRFPRAKIYRLDLVFEMLNAGRKKGLFARLIETDVFIQSNAEALPFADAAFDLVVSNQVLHWCTSLSQAIAEIARVLSASGVILFSTLGAKTLHELQECWGKLDKAPHVHPFLDMLGLGQTLLAAGLRDPVLDADEKVFVYSSVREIMRELKGMGGSNATEQRAHGLRGKAQLHQLIALYQEKFPLGSPQASFEIIYGHAFADATTTTQPIRWIGQPPR